MKIIVSIFLLTLISSTLLSGCSVAESVSKLGVTVATIPLAVTDGVLGTDMNKSVNESFEQTLHKMEENAKQRQLKSAYLSASTDKERAIAERDIVLALPAGKIFEVTALDRSDSSLSTLQTAGLMHSIKGQTKNITRVVEVTVRKDIPFPIKYADYEVEVDFKEMLDYEPPINGKGEDYASIKKVFKLGKHNNWSASDTIVFKGVPVFGTYRPGGVKLIGFFLGGMTAFGGKKPPKITEDSFDLDFKLKGSSLQSEVVSVK